MAYVLGVDGGIASVGWALLDDQERRIVAAGVWCFDPPEDREDHTPLNAIRRQHRGQRRVLRRRRQRMTALRELLATDGLLTEAGRDALRYRPGCDPWMLRAEALDRLLTGQELAVALGHIARHRGFRSNSKRDRGKNTPSDTSVMLKAVSLTTDRLAGRTVAQMAVAEPDWRDRKRNRGDYARTVLRTDLESEVRRIFSSQRRLGSREATEALEQAYVPLAFDQRPLQDSDDKVGRCTHEPSERRTAKRAPSFELFRLLARLRNLHLHTAAGRVALDAVQIRLACEGFGKKPALTFKQLRETLDLAVGVTFDGVQPADERKRDVATRSGGAAEGTHALRTALGESGWRALMSHPELLDQAAEILTFREDLGRIREGLSELRIEPWCVDLLVAAATSGAFARFKGAAHISAKTARAVNVGLRLGLQVDEAFAEAGYNHAARAVTDLKDVGNPVARKALGQMLRQVKTVVQEHRQLFGSSGLPDRIHVELARDVGKGQEERDKISAGLEKRTRAKEALRAELRELFPALEPGAEDLLRFELWKEQGRACPYSGESIPIAGVLASDNTYQVDHILPWSRFGDDSFLNKALVCAKANQDKRNRTPFEWLGEGAAWTLFAGRIEACKEMRGSKKARHYLRRNAAEVEERFRSRNLNDTRYACRLLLDMLARWYPAGERGTSVDDEKRHVFARPGALTSKLRQVWGLEGRKKGPDGKRLPDDRHHALDAIVVAACSEAMLQRLTRQVQDSEASGQRRPFNAMPEPWPGFREQALATLDDVFVARPERRRARGEAHAATIQSVGEREGREVVYKRKSVWDLTLKDVKRIKDGVDRNAPTMSILEQWIEGGKPKDRPPRSPKGDVIRKVRLITNDKVAVIVRSGTAGRGNMARVDVFREDRSTKNLRFHVVPIYPHQIFNALQVVAPNQAIAAHKEEDDWIRIDSFQFLFSLYKNSLIELTKPDGKVTLGYFRGVDRDNAKFDVADIRSPQLPHDRVASKTLVSLRKFSVDRLGRLSEIKQEVRTWRGVACT